jgi:hypothetical protein
VTAKTATLSGCPGWCEGHYPNERFGLDEPRYHEITFARLADVTVDLAAEDSLIDVGNMHREIYVALFTGDDNVGLTADEAEVMAAALLEAARRLRLGA